MIPTLKFIFLYFILFSVQNKICLTNSLDFQTDVNSFIEAFDEAYSTEQNEQVTNVIENNEIPIEQVPVLEEEPDKNKEVQITPVTEETIVAETVFPLGGDIHHELTPEVRHFAENVIQTISSDLRLINITEAVTSVTDKVRRRLSVVVGRQGCEDEYCGVSCVVELLSDSQGEHVTTHNCLETNDVTRVKRGAIGGFKQVDEKEAKELSEIAMLTLDMIDADDTKRVPIKVMQARKQLVNGIMYHLEMEVASSECREDQEVCEGPFTDYNICKILMQRLFSGEAPHKAQVIKSECTPISQAKLDTKRSKREISYGSNDINSIPLDDAPKKKNNRRMMGGPIEQDPESENIKDISSFALAQIDKSSNSLNKQNIVRVVEAKSQVVAGVKYFLKLELVETDCRKDSNQANCSPINKSVLQECEVVIWDKPWMKFRAMTKVNCQTVQHREKRATLGGKKPAEVNSYNIQKIAEYAVEQLDAKSNSMNAQKLVVVKEAQTQVVAGTNYFLKLQLVETQCRKGTTFKSRCEPAANSVVQECDVVIYDRPWDRHREMTSSECHPAPSTPSTRTRREVLVGGLSPTDPNGDKVQEMAQFAVSNLDASSNSINKQKLVVVKEAKTQVVAGVNYYLKLQMVETNCRKGATTNGQCNARPGSVVQECDVVVYDRPWDKHREMTSAKCSSATDSDQQKQRNRRDIKSHRSGASGGRVDMDKRSSKVMDLAHQAVRDVNRQINSAYKQALLEVVSAQSQVVSGIKYFLTVKVAETECRKNEHDDSSDSSDCTAPANAPTMLCDYTLYERAWENAVSSSFNCSSSRSVHSQSRLIQSSHLNQQGEMMPGSVVQMDRNSVKVQELATKAVRDVNMRLNSPYRQTLMQVISAKSQVVNGVKYYLKIAIGQTECYKNQPDSANCKPNADAPTMLCDYVIYQKPSENPHIHSHYCSDAPSGWRPSSHHHFTNPAQGSVMPGAPVDMDKRSSKVMDLSHQAVRDVNRQLNSPYKQALLEVVSAQSQVVNGVRYYLKLALAQTDCLNNGQDSTESSECRADADMPTMLCNFMFSEELGQNSVTHSSFNCSRPLTMSSQYTASETRTYQHQSSQETPRVVCAGCINDDDIHSGTIQYDAQNIVKDFIDKKSNSPYRHKLVEVVSSRTQVVAGIKTWLKIKIVESSCRKSSNEEIDQCLPRENAPIQECDVVSFVRPDQGKEMSFNCSSHITRSTHSQQLKHSQGSMMPGAPVDIDKRSSKVMDLAHQAVRDVNRQINSAYKQALLEVVSAQSQVVSGVKYYLTVVMAQTECRNNGEEDDSTECRASDNAPRMTCNFVFYERSGQNYMFSSSFNCSRPMTMSSRYTSSETRNYQHQQESGHPLYSESCPGCINDEDIHSETVQANARDLVHSLIDKKSSSPYRHKLVEVVSARSQVVSGIKSWFKIRIVESSCMKGSNEDINQCSPRDNAPVKECDVESFTTPDGGKQSSYNCSSHISYSTHSLHSAYSPCQESHENMQSLPGGLAPRNPNEIEIQQMARFALSELDASSNSLNLQKLLEVKEAQSQVVAGTNYYLKLRLVETNCRKGDQSPSGCAAAPGSVIQECDVVVYDRPWDNHREMTSASCKDIPQQAEMKTLGGRWEQLAPTDPKVQEAAKFSLKTIDSRNNQYYKSALVNVVDAKVQVVSGKKYMLVVEVGESTCSKYDEQENCPLKGDSSVRYRCNMVVWDRPWLNKKEVISSECKARTRRAAGGETESLKAEHLRLFEDFKSRYNRSYADEVEHNKRFRIFRANLKKIEAFQANEQGTAIYGASMFADVTEKEFKQKYLGLKRGSPPKPSPNHMLPAQIPDVELPTNFDWRDHGAVTPVKNQGQCGSCWAFSVTGNVEGQWFIKHGKLISLSEQELVDCDKSDNGCNGGYMTVAYESIEKLGGLETEEEYPYDARDESCHFNKSLATVTVASSLNITTNETQMAQWLFKNGPISIGINANAMQFYMGGVSHPFKFLCNKKELDHGVLLVGFGVHRTSIRHKLLPYWLVKNSWGPHWGEKGYYRVYRGDGTCGVNQMASSAIVS